MECVHCKRSFSKDTFDAHCREHAEIQTRLKRPTGRTYGARYEAKDHVLPSEEPRAQKQNAGSPVPPNAGSSVRLNEETLPSHQSALDGLDKRMHSITESFPPYDGDGVEAPWPGVADFACKDCSFKFWTRKECDEYYLSKYCCGADVLNATQQLLEPGLVRLTANFLDEPPAPSIFVAVSEVFSQLQQRGLLYPDVAKVDTDDSVSLRVDSIPIVKK
ncbi:hypothetical protein EDB80DRAFT_877400 [Ilyonectria destructans]|nr:hypothetical protein EDB80DRAFT_880263 [Ilyonectria destructans]KAH7021839.1 hypothetical protein EDB80DRAFT_877400 [Ilyonectria destructans]